ncbi:hypothetical protein [Paenibacillus taichungensis]|uniref:hypothetical protein n=1 Tax=Paenibacillus taichungensis TaxID=484184 RepID=UPI0035DD9D46
MNSMDMPWWQAIIYTSWWQTTGLIIGIALIVVTIYCLRDLKREQRAAAAAELNSNTPKWRTETIYLKKPTYIYPKNQNASGETSLPHNKILKGGYSNGK